MLISIDIGNAKIEGLEDSLGMTDTDYNVRNLEDNLYQNMAYHFHRLIGSRGHLLCSIRFVSILAPKYICPVAAFAHPLSDAKYPRMLCLPSSLDLAITWELLSYVGALS
jgi:hypothetical protein